MNDGKQEVQIQHKWLWAISPIAGDIAFVAHCRSCNNIFTQRLHVLANGSQLGAVDLPEWGCKNPMAALL